MKDFYTKWEVNGKEYTLAWNLNVMEQIQDKYGSLEAWGKISEGEEPKISSIIDAFEAMINEGIEIDNEKKKKKKKNGTNEKPLTHRQIGRIISAYGVENAAETMKNAISEATKDDTRKNA